jgi:dihydrolipoamide dehydrogenase
MEPHDVVVLGGGAGGVAAAIRVAQLGGSVAVVEDKFLGGLCMNRGCVPFGHMLAAAHILGSLELGKEMGITCSNLASDFRTLMKRQNELVAFMRQGVQGLFNKHKVLLIKGKGKLTGPNTIEVNGKPHSFKKIILASGGRWLEPEVPDPVLSGVINSDALLAAEALPKNALVLGHGARSIEVTQLLHRFGCSVRLVTHQSALLPRENRTIRTRLAKALHSQGIGVHTRAEIVAMDPTKRGLDVRIQEKAHEETLSVDCLISLRRGAALRDLGLENIGLRCREERIEVNERMETGVSGVFALGDLTASEDRQYSHLASAGGVVAAENAMGHPAAFNPRAAVRVIYSKPEVACVGLTSREAKEAGFEVIEGRAPLSMNPKGMILSQKEGTVEVVADGKYGEVLGIHYIGEGADEMVGAGVLAIQMEATLEELARSPFPHPTLSESLAEAARDALGRSLYLP